MRIKIIIIAVLIQFIGCEDNYYDDDYYQSDEKLYVVKSDGTGLEQIPVDANRFRDLAFLPDGSGIIFTARGNINGKFCYDLTTGNLVPFEDPTVQDSIWVYDDWDGEIYLVKSVKSDTTNVTNDGDYNRNPVLTADKTKVIFITTSYDYGEMSMECKLEVVEVGSQKRYNIAVFNDYIQLLTCSDDRLLVVYNCTVGFFNELLALRTDSLMITKICDTFLTYSADIDDSKTSIVFEAYSGDNDEIFLVDFKTLSKIKLTNSPGYDSRPLFSPDGMQILYDYYYQDKTGLYIMDCNGTNHKQLSHKHLYVRDRCFSPDGRLIAFACED